MRIIKKMSLSSLPLPGLSKSSLSGLTRQSKILVSGTRITALALSLALAAFSYAEMAELSDNDLQEATGQEGISISMKLDFAEGTRISSQNPETDGNNWEVMDSITGSIEAKKLRTELLDNYRGPKDNADGVSAAQTIFPDEINFAKFKTRGIYLGEGKEVERDVNEKVTGNHNFYMGLEIDGSLKLPAQTKLTTFVVNQQVSV